MASDLVGLFRDVVVKGGHVGLEGTQIIFNAPDQEPVSFDKATLSDLLLSRRLQASREDLFVAAEQDDSLPPYSRTDLPHRFQASLEDLFVAFNHRQDNWAAYSVAVLGQEKVGFRLREFNALISFWSTGDLSLIAEFRGEATIPCATSTSDDNNSSDLRFDLDIPAAARRLATRDEERRRRIYERDDDLRRFERDDDLRRFERDDERAWRRDGDRPWRREAADRRFDRRPMFRVDDDRPMISDLGNCDDRAEWEWGPTARITAVDIPAEHFDVRLRQLGDIDMPTRLTTRSPESLDHDDDIEPVHYAAQHGDIKAFQALIQRDSLTVTDGFQWNVFHYAARFGQLGVIKALVSLEHAAVNHIDKKGYTPLYYAAFEGHVSVVELLMQSVGVGGDEASAMHAAIQNGHLDVVHKIAGSAPMKGRWCDDEAWSVIHSAAKYGSSEVLQLWRQEMLDVQTTKGWTPLHVAVWNGHISVIEELVRLGSKAIDAPDAEGWTPMHHAVSTGNLAVVEALIRLGSQAIDTPCSRDGFRSGAAGEYPPRQRPLQPQLQGKERSLSSLSELSRISVRLGTCWTPMHIAAQRGFTTIIEALVRSGSQAVDALTTSTASSWREEQPRITNLTPLHLAAEIGNVEAIETLLRLGSQAIDIPDSVQATPLHVAAHNGHVQVVELLVQRGSRAADKPDSRGMTPLHNAVNCGHLQIVESLLRRAAQAAHIPNRCGWTPLHTAAFRRNSAVFQALVQSDARALDTPDYEGWRPLHVAAAQGQASIVEQILQMGCKEIDLPVSFECFRRECQCPEDERQNLHDFRSDRRPSGQMESTTYRTPMHMAARNGHAEVIEALARSGNRALDTPDRSGKTPMHLAALFGHATAIEMLVRLGSNAIDTPDKNGWTPLHFACLKQSDEIIETLVRLGSRAIDTPTNRRRTPISIAARYGKLGFIETLVRLGSQAIDIPDVEGCTAMHFAAKRGSARGVETLVRLGSRAIDAPDNEGWTPMHQAAMHIRTHVIQALFRLGSHADRLTTHASQLPIHLASTQIRPTTNLAACRFTACAQLLFCLGDASSIPRDLNQPLCNYLTKKTDEDELLRTRFEVHFALSLTYRLLLALGLPLILPQQPEVQFRDWNLSSRR